MQELSNAEIQLTQGQQQASDGKEQILAQVSQIQTQMGDAWPQDSWKSYETAVENGSTYNSEKTTFQTDLKTRIEVLNAALDTQILQLDPNAADYDMQNRYWKTGRHSYCRFRMACLHLKHNMNPYRQLCFS